MICCRLPAMQNWLTIILMYQIDKIQSRIDYHEAIPFTLSLEQYDELFFKIESCFFKKLSLILRIACEFNRLFHSELLTNQETSQDGHFFILSPSQGLYMHNYVMGVFGGSKDCVTIGVFRISEIQDGA